MINNDIVWDYKNNYIKPLLACDEEMSKTLPSAFHSGFSTSYKVQLEKLCDKYGYENISTIFMARLKHLTLDGRISRDIKDWYYQSCDKYAVKKFPWADPKKNTTDCYPQFFSLANIHPGHIDFAARWLKNSEEKYTKMQPKVEKTEKSKAEQLYDKMALEQKSFKHWLTSQTAEEVLNHCYEYTIREDILMIVECGEVTENEAEALLDSPTPLSDVYERFDRMDVTMNDYIMEAITDIAENSKKKNSETVDK